MMLTLAVASTTWLAGLQSFAVIMILPTVIYFIGHWLLRRYPKAYNFWHILFSIYMLCVFVMGLYILILG